MVLAFLNRCGWRAASNGTGTFTYASALTGMYAPASCTSPVVVDGASYRYFAQSDDLTQHEEGLGVWTVASSTLTRVPYSSTNSAAVVNFSAAPQVRMGGPLAQDQVWDKIGSYDFDTTAADHADFSLNQLVYSSYRITINGLELEIPAGDVGDYITVAIDILNSSNTALYTPIEEFGSAYAANWDGTNFVGFKAEAIDSIFHVGSYGANIPGNISSIVNISDNTITSFSTFDAYSWSKSYDTPPATAATLRLKALQWDNSIADYVAIDFISGKIELYGLRY